MPSLLGSACAGGCRLEKLVESIEPSEFSCGNECVAVVVNMPSAQVAALKFVVEGDACWHSGVHERDRKTGCCCRFYTRLEFACNIPGLMWLGVHVFISVLWCSTTRCNATPHLGTGDLRCRMRGLPRI